MKRFLAVFCVGLSWLFRVVMAVLLLYVVLFFVGRGLANFKDIGKFPAFVKVLVVEKAVRAPAADFLRANVPTNFKGTDAADWIVLAAVLLLLLAAAKVTDVFQVNADNLRRQLKAEAERKLPSGIRESLSDIQAGKEIDRKKLLEIYAEARKALESQKIELAFLSVDIADSTGMKVGEEQAVAERDFGKYKEMVEAAIQPHGVLKAAWTPDGVMFCFPSTRAAVKAAQAILVGLIGFNKGVKRMRRDFTVRMGVNSGAVMFDETVPMEEMSDRVIDVTGHMQKHGSPNAITISKEAIEPFQAEFSFKPTDRVVDGFKVYEWKP